MAVGEGKGKLLLFGEHSAVYGYPAVGMQLARALTLELEERPSDEWFLPEVEPGAARMIAEALEQLPEVCSPAARQGGEVLPETNARVWGGAGKRLTVTAISGDLPMSLGFGSSAAFCTALVRAYAPSMATDEYALWAAAHKLEHVFHGSPSGIDTGLSVFAGASVIRATPPEFAHGEGDPRREHSAYSHMPRREAVMLPAASLLVGAIPREKSTAELIAGLREQRRQRPQYVEVRMERLGSLAEAGAGARDAAELGELANEAHTLLCELGLSTQTLDVLIDQLRDLGASGAKLSGAGGGGAFYGVFADRDSAADAAERIKKNGLPHLSVEETVQA